MRADVTADAKMHGIAFRLTPRPKTGDRLFRDQIERRMAIIAPHFGVRLSLSQRATN